MITLILKIATVENEGKRGGYRRGAYIPAVAIRRIV